MKEKKVVESSSESYWGFSVLNMQLLNSFLKMKDHADEINALTEPVNSQCDDKLSLTLSFSTKNI